MRHVPLIATLAPIWMPSTLPEGNSTLKLLKSCRSLTSTTEAWPCTIPVQQSHAAHCMLLSSVKSLAHLLFALRGRCQSAVLSTKKGQQKVKLLPVNRLQICNLPRFLQAAACVQRGLCILQICSKLPCPNLHVMQTVLDAVVASLQIGLYFTISQSVGELETIDELKSCVYLEYCSVPRIQKF